MKRKRIPAIRRPPQPYICSPEEALSRKLKRKFLLIVGRHDEWLEVLKAARQLWRDGKIVMCLTTDDGKVPAKDVQKIWKSAPLYPVWRAVVDPNAGEIVLDMVLWSRYNPYPRVSYVFIEIEKQTGMDLWDRYVDARRRILREEYRIWESVE